MIVFADGDQILNYTYQSIHINEGDQFKIVPAGDYYNAYRLIHVISEGMTIVAVSCKVIDVQQIVKEINERNQNY